MSLPDGYLDLDLTFGDVVAERGLSRIAAEYVYAALRGRAAGRGKVEAGAGNNFDLPAWTAVRVAAALAMTVDGPPTRRADAVIALLFDRSLARATHFEARFAVWTDGGDASCSFEGGQLHLVWPAGTFDIGLHDVAVVAATLDVLMVSADETGTLPALAPLREAFALLGDVSVPFEIRLQGAARIVTRVYDADRTRRFPVSQFERRNHSLAQFLKTRHGADPRRWLLTDADCLDFWTHQVQAGDRPLFKKTVEILVRYRTILEETDSSERQATTLDLADIENFETKTLSDVVVGGRLGEALEAIPHDPKILTDRQRETLRLVFAFQPFERALPLTVLRVYAFAPVQALLVQAHRDRRDLANVQSAAFAKTPDYSEALAQIAALSSHLKNMLIFALRLRHAGDGNPGQGDVHDDDEVEAGGADVATLVKAAKWPRRQGFDRPVAELAEIFAAIDGDLATLREALEGFLAACRRLSGPDLETRYRKDREAFEAMFAQLYHTS